MITLYCYPGLFGLPDNNPFGLKLATYFEVIGIDFTIENTVSTDNAPRGQLPYIKVDDRIIGDSNHINQFINNKFGVSIDDHLNSSQLQTSFLVNRMLDNHLYWIMSYSRWQDETNWPKFKKEFLKSYPTIDETVLEKARTYNCNKYYLQGIGRHLVDEVYQQGVDDLRVISSIINDTDYLFSDTICSIDTSIYGFLANIYYFDIDTPLKDYICKSRKLKDYIERIRENLNY